MPEIYNSLYELRDYFGENKPLSMTELMTFWRDLTWTERLYFKRASLT